MITKPQRLQPDQTQPKLLQMSGDVHPNPGPATKYPCPVCTRNLTSRGVKCDNEFIHCSAFSDDSKFDVLHLNANRIGNKLTELVVVLERNNESKLSPKSKIPCIRNYTTVRKDRPHGHGGGLLTFIHRSITVSKQPSSPESPCYPHLEELSIKLN